MTSTFDIITEEGGKLLTCVNDNDRIFFRGKQGILSFEKFMAQIVNPALATQMRKQGKNMI